MKSSSSSSRSSRAAGVGRMSLKCRSSNLSSRPRRAAGVGRMNFTCQKIKSVQHSTRENRRYGQHKSQEGVVGQHAVGEESGKRVKGKEG